MTNFMSNPKKQHFLPEVYINRFSFDNNGNVYTFKAKSPFKNVKIKVLNKSQFCYKPNLYTFNDKEKHPDQYLLERSKFDYEHKFLKEICDRIDKRENINSNDAERFIKMLMGIKQRNITINNFLNSKSVIEYLSNRQVNIFRKYLEKYILQLGEYKIEKILEYIENELIKNMQDLEIRSDIQNEALLSLIENRNEEYNQLVKKLTRTKFKILTTSTVNPFISSDNPGFTYQGKDRICNMLFGSAKLFIFPISPESALYIDLTDTEPFEPIIKRILYTKVSDEMIELINSSTVVNCNELIFSINETSLRNSFESYKKRST